MSVFKTEPYAHQLRVFERSKNLPEFALFLEMGTGKSKVLIDTAAHLSLQGKIGGLVVIAPKGVYGNWVRKEIPTHLSDAVPAQVYCWTAAKTKTNERKQAEILRAQEFAVLVMNVEALSTRRGAEYCEKFLAARPCLFAVDESSTIKNPSAARTKACIRLAKLAPYRRILTGSPVTKAPLDVYAQMQALRPGILGFSSFFSFRNRYGVVEKDVVRRGGALRQYTHVTGYRRLDELHAKLQEHSARVLKADCLDLPEKVYTSRDVELTDEQRKAYNEMRQEAITMLDGMPATAQAVITQLLRLHQILCGHLPTVDGQVHELPSNRMKVLLEAIEEAGTGQMIIWATYRHDIELISRELAKVFGADKIATYYGGTSAGDREDALVGFADGRIQFFVGNQQTGGYGLTLTEADKMFYYSNNFDLEKRLQSEDRAHRIGQTKSLTICDLIVRDSLDERVLTSLREKMNLAAQVTGDGWRDWLVS